MPSLDFISARTNINLISVFTNHSYLLMLAVQNNLLPRFLLLLSMAMVSLPATSQVNIENNDPVYGYDPLLYNGKIYNFYPQAGTEGTQYLFDTFDSLASITVRGVTYEHITLNYDIYNQLLILKYKNAVGSQSFIEISYAWLEKASLWSNKFETFTTPNSTKRLYQVIGNANEKILYYMSKDLLLENLKSSKNHYFTSVKKDMFVWTNNRLSSFKNNVGFIKSFSQKKQSFIKSYLRSSHINVRKANGFLLIDLINYCNSLQGS